MAEIRGAMVEQQARKDAHHAFHKSLVADGYSRRWIAQETRSLKRAVDAALEAYRLSVGAGDSDA